MNSSNSQLSQLALQGDIKLYIDRKIVEMEESLACRHSNLLEIKTDRFFEEHSKLMRRINGLESEIQALNNAVLPQGLVDLSPPDKIRYTPRQAHTASEIRGLILQNGHRVVVSEPFNCKQYAIQLEKVAELRPGDRAAQAGQTVFRKRVQTTMSDWVNGATKGILFYGDCPFERIGRFEYAVKEAWQWPKQTA